MISDVASRPWCHLPPYGAVMCSGRVATGDRAIGGSPLIINRLQNYHFITKRLHFYAIIYHTGGGKRKNGSNSGANGWSVLYAKPPAESPAMMAVRLLPGASVWWMSVSGVEVMPPYSRWAR